MLNALTSAQAGPVLTESGESLPALPLPSERGGFSSNPSVVYTAVEAKLPVVWLVMDNAGFGTIGRLEKIHYGGNFGCTFEADGKPYWADYAAMARSAGARGGMIKSAGELGPSLKGGGGTRLAPWLP